MRTLEELGISPAPWEAEVFADGHYAYITARSVNGNKKIVGSEHSTADARLIAVAPMLYEALRKLVDYLSLNNWTDRELDPFIEAADAALAAASGESEAAKLIAVAAQAEVMCKDGVPMDRFNAVVMELSRWRDAFNRLQDAVGCTLDEPFFGMCPQSVYGPLCKALAEAIQFQEEIGARKADAAEEAK